MPLPSTMAVPLPAVYSRHRASAQRFNNSSRCYLNKKSSLHRTRTARARRGSLMMRRACERVWRSLGRRLRLRGESWGVYSSSLSFFAHYIEWFVQRSTLQKKGAWFLCCCVTRLAEPGLFRWCICSMEVVLPKLSKCFVGTALYRAEARRSHPFSVSGALDATLALCQCPRPRLGALRRDSSCVRWSDPVELNPSFLKPHAVTGC